MGGVTGGSSSPHTPLGTKPCRPPTPHHTPGTKPRRRPPHRRGSEEAGGQRTAFQPEAEKGQTSRRPSPKGQARWTPTAHAKGSRPLRAAPLTRRTDPAPGRSQRPRRYLRRRRSREALRWSRLRLSRLRLRRLRSRLRERLWLRFRCRFSLSRSGKGGEDELREDGPARPHWGPSPSPGRPPRRAGVRARGSSRLPGSKASPRPGPRTEALPAGTGLEVPPGCKVPERLRRSWGAREDRGAGA